MENYSKSLPETGFIRLSELIGKNSFIPVSRSALLNWVAEGKFPSPVKIGSRVSAWRVEDIRAYIAQVGEVR